MMTKIARLTIDILKNGDLYEIHFHGESGDAIAKQQIVIGERELISESFIEILFADMGSRFKTLLSRKVRGNKTTQDFLVKENEKKGGA
jgi:hypothetical protein